MATDVALAQTLSPRVEAAIARILGADAGDFDGPGFSAVDWVNGAFPDEAACGECARVPRRGACARSGARAREAAPARLPSPAHSPPAPTPRSRPGRRD